jgi:hypothetical protein
VSSRPRDLRWPQIADARGTPIDTSDRIRVLRHPSTESAGIADLVGTIFGFSTPSQGYVPEFIGDAIDDVVINVDFGGTQPSTWVVPSLVEFVDHNPGMTMGVGDRELVRNADGSWTERKRDGPPP